MRYIVSTYLPRSYLHLREAYEKIKDSEEDISNKKLDKSLTFTIKNIYKSYEGCFSLSPTGLYTINLEVADKEQRYPVIKAMEDALEKFIKKWHNVIQTQIEEGVLPLFFSVLVFSFKKNLELNKNTIIEYSKERYFPRAIESYKTYQFLKILQKFNSYYMELMEKYYHKADGIIKKLKGNFELTELKKTVFEMDFVEKNTGEIISRIEDIKDSTHREKEKISSLTKKVFLNQNLKDLFQEVETDLQYIQRLWNQQDTMLDNLDNASQARLSYQETLESRKVQGFLSIEAASVIATLILGLFISGFTGINAWYLLGGFALAWIIIYNVMTRFKTKS
ncbi:hypothetical protein HOD29_03295 [archaeon]|jgi:hypothetical protein|nr:hypothetical protein [archaeon]